MIPLLEDLSAEEQAEMRFQDRRIKAAWSVVEYDDYLYWESVFGEGDEYDNEGCKEI